MCASAPPRSSAVTSSPDNTEDAQISNPNDDVSPQPELRDIVPLDGKKGYDVRDVISKIVDWGVKATRHHLRLVGHDADGTTIDPGKGGDDVGRPTGLDL
jgi:hypothetical protein